MWKSVADTWSVSTKIVLLHLGRREVVPVGVVHGDAHAGERLVERAVLRTCGGTLWRTGRKVRNALTATACGILRTGRCAGPSWRRLRSTPATGTRCDVSEKDATNDAARP